MPTAPYAASSNGRRLDSVPCGSWFDVIISIVSLFKFSSMYERSFSDRSGGLTLKNVLYAAISFSFNFRLLIDTPHVILSLISLNLLTTS